MNIRIPNSFDSATEAVRSAPDRAAAAYQRTSSRGRLIWGIVGAILLAFIAWMIYAALLPAPVRKTPPAAVVVQKVQQTNLPVVEHTIGTVVSNATVQVTARVTGQLLKAYFTEGQTVHKGDLLFQIDPRPYQATLDNALAVLGTAKAKWARYGQLLAQKAIAAQDADDAKAAYLQAEANVDAARLNLDYTQIRSPIDGKTGPIMIQPGNMITATGGNGSNNSSTTTGAIGSTTNSTTTSGGSGGGNPLVVITQLSPIKISFALPQADLPRIQKQIAARGMTVSLMQQGASDGQPLQASVDFVGNQVNDQAGTIELRATFGNENGTLVPGQLVDVAVVLAAIDNALVVPHDAINLGPSQSFVYLVKQGKAVMVPVTVVHDDGTSAAIQGKVKAGDTVIVDGQLKVIPGGPVRISGQHRKK